jgi:TRAP-type C4-dicarboxylate transport system permease small subunit
MKVIEKYLMKIMNTIIVVSLTLMVIMVFSNVVMRYAFNSGITSSEEMSRFLFLWLIFIGAIVAMKENAHLGVDTLVARMPRSGKIACVLLSNALMLWCCYLFFVGSWRQTVVGLGTEMPATGISMAYHYATGLVMSVGIGTILISNSWRILSGRAADADLIQITESEEVETTTEAEDDLARDAKLDAKKNRLGDK